MKNKDHYSRRPQKTSEAPDLGSPNSRVHGISATHHFRTERRPKLCNHGNPKLRKFKLARVQRGKPKDLNLRSFTTRAVNGWNPASQKPKNLASSGPLGHSLQDLSGVGHPWMSETLNPGSSQSRILGVSHCILCSSGTRVVLDFGFRNLESLLC